MPLYLYKWGGGALKQPLQPYERIARTHRHAVDKCANLLLLDYFQAWS